MPTLEDPSASISCFAAWIRDAPRILFVTGAGLSADSGLPTYRGVGGVYEDAATEDGFPVEVALSGPMLAARPDVAWRTIGQVERACRGAAPNRAHAVIAELQRRRAGVVVLTQNVDGLHRAAGSDDVIEVHGNLHALACTRCSWDAVVPDYAALELPPRCPACDGLVRPRVVLFGEALPALAMERLRAELAQGFALVVVVGTTAAFPYVAAPVHMAARWGARTVEVNPGRSEVSHLCDLRLVARAAPTFDALAAALGYG